MEYTRQRPSIVGVYYLHLLLLLFGSEEKNNKRLQFFGVSVKKKLKKHSMKKVTQHVPAKPEVPLC